MARIDNYMIIITIGIVLLALAPFFSPTIEWDREVATVEREQIAKETDERYFSNVAEKIEEAKEKVRDLMAEHEAANP
tara:strand:- start:386 stop:619 length:234 start_codon:yes stop_codon:yes gene_type:complete